MNAYKCQEDSYLKQYTTKVVSCEYKSIDWAPPGETDKQILCGFNVVLENTILFATGGGQPCDFGTINGYPVRSVERSGRQAIHFVEANDTFELGSEVLVCLDWDRRLDHMQQHTGQHLITALFDREFKYNTATWLLGPDVTYIDLNTPHLISRESLDLIERKANELIFEGRAVTVELIDPQVFIELPDARAPRNLPRNHVGLARVVRIEGIESNMCCGTHLKNLSHLQCVKLLHAEKAKNNNVLVYFVCGLRALRMLGECHQREQMLNLVLKGGPKEHVDLVQKLQVNLKTIKKSFQRIIRDVAAFEAERIAKHIQPRPKYYCLHRKDGIEMDFIHTFLNKAPEDVFYFLTISENKPIGAAGHVVLRGDPALVDKFGPIFLEILNGKGLGKPGSLQAKITNVNKIPDCEKILDDYFRVKKPASEPESSSTSEATMDT